jgi:prepilin-type N-terminal cleavage/methylation domain-containing protein
MNLCPKSSRSEPRLALQVFQFIFRSEFVGKSLPCRALLPGLMSRRNVHAFTLLELLTTIAIIAVLAALLLPALQSSYGKARRIACSSQLKQIGVAFHSWAHEHNDLYPMQVPVAAGGTKEFADLTAFNPNESYTYLHFQVVSNELVTPKVLRCPADRYRTEAKDFASLRNENVSYWLNNSASFGRADSPLAGDRNVRTSGRTEWTFLQFSPADGLEFSAELHGYRGNVLFSDAHVDTLDSQALRLAFAQITNASTVTISLPSRDVPPGTAPEIVAAPANANPGGAGGGGGAAPPVANPAGNAGTTAGGGNPRPLAFGHNSGPPTLDGGGAVYAQVELVVFTKLDGTFVTSAVPRRYTNVTMASARPPSGPMEVEKGHPLMEFAESTARKAQSHIHWLLLILLLMVALSIWDRIRRKLRGKRRGADL